MMPNSSESRREARAEALSELLKALREVQPPPGRRPGWITEFRRGASAVGRMLENQIAQAERRIVPRLKQRTPRKRGDGSAV
jgi:hypothetical protein